jgi:A/G-specific adenine glycosylase
MLRWFEANQRDLPWRRTRDPYLIWLSEIMLQQTRVAAVIPYYERFVAKYPDLASLAAAPEDELLGLWAGLGYYSRARNLQKAAREMVRAGAFPRDYAAIRALPGVGDYTAAAVGSIAFGIPEAVLDGNVIRVMARVICEQGEVGNSKTKSRLRQEAQNQLDRERPGEFNQALMELGATICLPKAPKCLICPINDNCCARSRGLENTLPIKLKKKAAIAESKELLLICDKDRALLWRRRGDSRRLAGFWELPEADSLKGVRRGRLLGRFRHAIVNHKYEVSVYEGKLKGEVTDPYQWFSWLELGNLPLSTMAQKSLKLRMPVPNPEGKAKG